MPYRTSCRTAETVKGIDELPHGEKIAGNISSARRILMPSGLDAENVERIEKPDLFSTDRSGLVQTTRLVSPGCYYQLPVAET
jgi:hypothetical protein